MWYEHTVCSTWLYIPTPTPEKYSFWCEQIYLLSAGKVLNLKNWKLIYVKKFETRLWDYELRVQGVLIKHTNSLLCLHIPCILKQSKYNVQ